jgi:hypothetical protein
MTIKRKARIIELGLYTLNFQSEIPDFIIHSSRWSSRFLSNHESFLNLSNGYFTGSKLATLHLTSIHSSLAKKIRTKENNYEERKPAKKEKEAIKNCILPMYRKLYT